MKTPNRFWIIPLTVTLVGTFAAGWLFGSQSKNPRTTAAGGDIEIVRPTGETVLGANGSGDPMPRTEKTKLKIYRVSSSTASPPSGRPVWTVALNGVVYFATEEN